MEEKEIVHQHFLSRLKEKARKKFGFEAEKDYGIQTKIAEVTHIDQRTVSNWFDEDKKTVPNAEHLVKVHKALGLSPNVLLGIEDSKKKSLVQIVIRKEDQDMIGREPEARLMGNYTVVPIAKGENISGEPDDAREDPEELAVVYRDWVENNENFTAIWIRENDMAKTIQEGSLVGIDHSKRNAENLDGKIVALRKGNGLAIRRLKVVSKDLVIGVSDEPECLEKLIVLKGQQIRTGIIGQVAWWWTRQE